MTTEEKATQSTKNIGLRGVTVADTKVSHVDGQNGILLYRGYNIADLAEKATYEEVVYLLLHGCLPSAEQKSALASELAGARDLPPELYDYLHVRTRSARPMDVLQGAVAVLADHDPGMNPESKASALHSSLMLIGRTASLITALHHIREGRVPPAPDTVSSHAAAVLYGLWGRHPTPEEEKLMDILLTIHAEHSLNASTFAAREVASTRAHLYNSIAAAVGALSGDLHGGANARVMKMLMDVGSLDNVAPWVTKKVDSGERVMGFGHAVYRTEDPRAKILKRIANKVLAGRPEEKYYQLGLAVEAETRRQLLEKKGLDLYPNVDFFSAPIFYAVGIPIDLFPAFFALSRSAGWCSHYIEEFWAEAQPKPALYRPAAYYVGRHCHQEGCRFVPVEQRGFGCPCGSDFNGCNEKTAVEEP
jgi:citrate synthase